MADLSFPIINGVRHSWASVIVNIGASQFLGCKSVNYSDGVDPATLHGTGQNILGTTAGPYSATGDIEFYFAEAMLIIQALGNGWTDIPLTVQVQYAAAGLPTQTHKLPVRFTKLDEGGTEGAEGLTGKFTMTFLDSIDRNGVKAVRPINAAQVSLQSLSLTTFATS